MIPRRLHRNIRDLHLYLGLFISPFVLVFAFSVILLNHAYLPWGGNGGETFDETNIVVALPSEDDNLALARHVRREIHQQTGMSGEIGSIARVPARNRLRFAMEKPGEVVQVRVGLDSGDTQLRRRKTGVWSATNYLHMMPGPHLIDIRGNWAFTRVWGWVSDATVSVMLFLTVTGVYLWAVLTAERRTGLIMLGGGVLSFFVIVTALMA